MDGSNQFIYQIFFKCAFGIAILVHFIALPFANIWYTESSVTQELQHIAPATTVVSFERNFWRYSRIVVNESGVTKTYLLDTNMLLEHQFMQELEKPTR